MAVGRMRTDTLTTALARLLTRELMPDLRERSRQPAIEAELTDQHRQEREAKKTGASFIEWREQLLDQVGAAWVLSCVFVRTLEDRGLLDRRRLAGPEGADSQELFFQLAPHLGHRDYLLTVFGEISRLPGAADLLGRKHNAAWRLGISQSAAKGLVEFFRQTDEDGEVRWSFGGEDSRFLGDLYQDLSEAVRDRYALLQTPEFVEEFILDRTLEPAIEEFGLETVKVLDPTCGSGHFLLGAFRRLFAKRMAVAPGQRVEKAALAALGQVCGIDLNPYAVAIARFRLTLEFLRVVGAKRLRDAPRELGVGLAVADSLLVEGGQSRVGRTVTLDFGEYGDGDEGWGEKFSLFSLEDPKLARGILQDRYHVVVGNPPYITCKDAVLRDLYRERYSSAAGKYALSAPFCQRFFQLAAEQGYVGQITSNSFMKREFGKGLVQEVLPHLDLTEIYDTAGAYIPGHGTPTVILVGRNQPPMGTTVFAVQGKRGEPSTPADPAKGKVWSSILAGVRAREQGLAGFEDEFTSTASLERRGLREHPWSLGGGGASELKEVLDGIRACVLADVARSIGPISFCGEDEVYIFPASALERLGLGDFALDWVTGDVVRDWTIVTEEKVIYPYKSLNGPAVELSNPRLAAHFWNHRESLRTRVTFGKSPVERGLKWYEHTYRDLNKLTTSLGISFAYVATHNHFVLDRGGKVFNRSAPVIKLPANATEDDHLALLGLLNSSVACFWMKQVFYPKSGSGIGRGIQSEAWMDRYEFDGTKIAEFPIVPAPENEPTAFAQALDSLATRRQLDDLTTAIASAAPAGAAALRTALATRRSHQLTLLYQMVALQEELDWLCYGLYSLLQSPTVRQPSACPPLHPGHRPFEILLARRDLAIAAGPLSDEQPTAWFTRHGWEPTTDLADIPDPDTRALVAERIALIENSRDLALIESATHKRRWYKPDFAAEEKTALQTYLLTTLETHLISTSTTPTTLREAAATLALSPTVAAVAEVLTSTPDYDLPSLLTTLALTDAVPYLAALRYTDAGLEKHTAWQATWALQRREDAGEALDIPVPPKYASTDFRQATYWQLRGKLDVPKERFVLYPGAERDDDPTPVLLWAGADHLQRALALAALYHDRQTNEGWPAEKLLPLLAGLDELVPWLQQWHDDPDPARGGRRMGQYFARFVEEEARKQGAAPADLRAWRPEARRAGKGRKAKG